VKNTTKKQWKFKANIKFLPEIDTGRNFKQFQTYKVGIYGDIFQ